MLGIRSQHFGFRFWHFGFRFQVFKVLEVEGLGLRVQGLGFKGSRVQSLGSWRFGALPACPPRSWPLSSSSQ